MPVEDITSKEWKVYSPEGAIAGAFEKANKRYAEQAERKSILGLRAKQEKRLQGEFDIKKEQAQYAQERRPFEEKAKQARLDASIAKEKREQDKFSYEKSQRGKTASRQEKLFNLELNRLKTEQQLSKLKLTAQKGALGDAARQRAEALKLQISKNIDTAWRMLHTNERAFSEIAGPTIGQYLQMAGVPGAEGVDGVKVIEHNGEMVWVPTIKGETIKDEDGQELMVDWRALLRPANPMQTKKFGETFVDPLDSAPGNMKGPRPDQTLSAREIKTIQDQINKMINLEIKASGKSNSYTDRGAEMSFYRTRTMELHLGGMELSAAFNKAKRDYAMELSRKEVEQKRRKLEGMPGFLSGYNFVEMANDIDSMFPDETNGNEIHAWLRSIGLPEQAIAGVMEEFEQREQQRNPNYVPMGQQQANSQPQPGAQQIPPGIAEQLQPGETLMVNPATGEFGAAPQGEVDIYVQQGWQVVQ